MQHGHPLTNCDTILESGNALAKNRKRQMFWGGTDEEEQGGAEGAAPKRTKYSVERAKKTASGYTTYTYQKEANPAPERQLVENMVLATAFQTKKQRGLKTKGPAAQHMENLRSAQGVAQRDFVADELESFGTTLAAAAEPEPEQEQEQEQEPAQGDEDMQDALNEAQLSKMKMPQLKELCRDRGLSQQGLQAELIRRLLA